MKTIGATYLAEVIKAAIPKLAFELPDDVLCALVQASVVESNPRGAMVLDHLVKNAHIATKDQVPICQDTGIVWICLEFGSDIHVAGDVFSGIDEAIASAYDQANLRKSVVRDAVFDRSNTGSNTPAFCELRPVNDAGVSRLHIMLKGGGSDNASRVVMLSPGAGRQGILDEVVLCVKEKAANACAPLVVGVGIGGTFDTVAGLAKHALMRPVDQVSSDPQLAELETELLQALNATGAGPGGLGGSTTALTVKVCTAPCHIAALPLAINVGCSATRRCTIELQGDTFGVTA